MGGDHMCPVCSATFTRPQHVARHMRSHTGDRPYGCQMCGDRFARSDLLSRHVNKCHTPGGLTNTTTRKGQSSRGQAAAEDKKRRPCEACNLHSTKCDFGKPCSSCSSRGSKCAYSKVKRARRDTNPSPSAHATNLPPNNPQGAQESLPISSFGGGYQDDITPFSFSYPPQDNSMSMPHLFDPSLSVPNPNPNTFMGSPDAPSLSFSAATSDSAESTPWNPLEYMGMPGSVSNNGLDGNSIFPDPNAPSFSSTHKLQSQGNHPFAYNVDQSQYDQQPLTSMHQRSGSSVQRHHQPHHQRHRSTPSLEGQHPLLNSTLLRAQAQQYPAITPNRLYMHRGSISASDSGTDYDSSTGRPGTAGGYSDYPSPMSLTNSETGSVGQGVGRALDDMTLHDPGSNILSMGSMIVPGIGMGTGLTPATESPSRPSMTQRQSTFGDLRAFWNECMDKPGVGNMHGNSNENRHSLTKMTSMPCLKTPLGDATPRAASHDPLSRIGQKGNNSSLHTPRVINHTDPKSLEQYQHAIDARQPPSLQIAPKMKAAAAAAKQEDVEPANHKQDTFAVPFPPGTAQADAWRSLMSGASGNGNDERSGGSYVADSRPSYKRLPSQTLGPENSKRAHHDDNDNESALNTDEEEEEEYKEAQREWHRRMSLPAGVGRSNGRLYQPQPMPVPSPRIG